MNISNFTTVVTSTKYEGDPAGVPVPAFRSTIYEFRLPWKGVEAVPVDGSKEVIYFYGQRSLVVHFSHSLLKSWLFPWSKFSVLPSLFIWELDHSWSSGE